MPTNDYLINMTARLAKKYIFFINIKYYVIKMCLRDSGKMFCITSFIGQWKVCFI